MSFRIVIIICGGRSVSNARSCRIFVPGRHPPSRGPAQLIEFSNVCVFETKRKKNKKNICGNKKNEKINKLKTPLGSKTEKKT